MNTQENNWRRIEQQENRMFLWGFYFIVNWVVFAISFNWYCLAAILLGSIYLTFKTIQTQPQDKLSQNI